MSSTAAAPTISFSGLASGIDTASVIAQLSAVARKPITQEQNIERGYNNKLTAWQDFNVKLASVQSAATALTLAGTFQATASLSSNTTVASISSVGGASVGDHSLTVLQTAQAQKVVSGTFTSGSTALGKSGTFTLNGKAIQIVASDALTDVAAKINAAGAGANAQVVNVGTNDFRMTLSSTATGKANALSLADGTAGGPQPLLVGLGLLQDPAQAGYAPGIRQQITSGAQTGAASLAISSATQTVATTLGLSTPPAAGSVTIGGQAVSIDLSQDSLTSIAAKINGAGITGVTAQVVGVPDANGKVTAASKQQLQILGGGSAPAFADTNNILSTLGVIQGGFTNQIVQPQDASFTVDGLSLTRSSNVVNDAIPGASVKLLGAGSSTLSVSQDTASISAAVNNFVSAYNAAQDYVAGQNVFTAPASGTAGTDTSSSTPALFGDSTLQSMQQDLSRVIGAVSGTHTLASVGITLNAANELVVNADALTSALQADPSQVSNLFGLSGLSDNSSVKFVGANGKTHASSGQGFAVNITAAATQATGEAGTAHTSLTTASTAAETLTFGGTTFTTPVSITLPPGNALQDTVNQINTNSGLNGKVYASIDRSTNKLVLSSLSYGAGNGFTVSSSLAADGTNSGIGPAGTMITDGADVQGTLNGEPATGKGQTLSGSAGNATTEGLQLLVTGSQTGSLGHVGVTHGAADALNTLVNSFLDPTLGGVIGAENSLNSQITDTQHQIQQIQDQVTSYTAYLTQLFSAMETRVSELQAQGSAFAAAVGSIASSSGTKKTA